MRKWYGIIYSVIGICEYTGFELNIVKIDIDTYIFLSKITYISKMNCFETVDSNIEIKYFLRL
jgi:hypothetical protein